MVQTCFGDDSNTAAQQFLRIQQQATQGEGTGSRSQSHQQIDVAGGTAIVTAHRAENLYTHDAASACQGQQFGAVGFDQRM